MMTMEPVFGQEPRDKEQFTQTFDTFYTRFAVLYDLAITLVPIWKTWIRAALPHIEGPKVLEVSFGTGYLLTQYASRFETHGIDFNPRMVSLAKQNLERKNTAANLQVGNVESLPYPNEFFDTLVNTMAFSGYPNGRQAMSEMCRVLKPKGKLILIDINYPRNRNAAGMLITKFWMLSGDIIRDMDNLMDSFNLEFSHIEIGGFGSVHLYIARKQNR